MEEVKKVILLLESSGRDRADKASFAKGFFPEMEVRVVFVEPVASFEELQRLLQNNQTVVMIDRKILPDMVLAELLLCHHDIVKEVQIREPFLAQVLNDEKDGYHWEFRGYSATPITQVVFK